MAYMDLKVSIFKNKLMPPIPKSVPFNLLPDLVIRNSIPLHISLYVVGCSFFPLFPLLYLISHKALWTPPSHFIFPIYCAISNFRLNHRICLSVNCSSAFFSLFPSLLLEESINAKCLLNLLKILTASIASTRGSHVWFLSCPLSCLTTYHSCPPPCVSFPILLQLVSVTYAFLIYFTPLQLCSSCSTNLRRSCKVGLRQINF